jgi:hypothetical protein
MSGVEVVESSKRVHACGVGINVCPFLKSLQLCRCGTVGAVQQIEPPAASAGAKTVNLVNGNARKEIRRKQDGNVTNKNNS